MVNRDPQQNVQKSSPGLDPLLDKAYEFVIQSNTISPSAVQRGLGIGYARAAKIVDELESAGVVSGPNGSKPRVVINKSGVLNPSPDAYVQERDRSEMEQKSKDEAQYRAILAKNQRYIDRFCEIAYREVTTLDEWGDENVDCLARLKYECIVRIAKNTYQDSYLKNKLKTEMYIQNLFDKQWRDEGGEILSDKSAYWVRRLFNDDLPKAFEHYRAIRRMNQDHGHTDFRKMSGVDFENYVGGLLIGSGFNVFGTPKTGDQGADLIATKDGRTYVVQVKKYTNPVGNTAVQEVVAARSYYNGDVGVVITNSTFTPQAKKLAEKNNVMLIDKHRMKYLGNTPGDIDRL